MVGRSVQHLYQGRSRDDRRCDPGRSLGAAAQADIRFRAWPACGHAAMMSLLLMLAGAAAMPSAATAQSLAIVHAKAWTMQSATPVPNATIVVEDGRILSVREAGVVPPGVQVIDAAGMPVTPGFMNAATQIGLIEVIAAQETRDTAAPAGKDARRGALGPSFDISFALNGNSALVALARADGLTSALSFPSVSGVAPFAGQAAIVRLRDGADILDRARTAMFVVIGGGAWDKAAESRAAQWQLLRGELDEARVPRPVAGGGGALPHPAPPPAPPPPLAGGRPAPPRPAPRRAGPPR